MKKETKDSLVGFAILASVVWVGYKVGCSNKSDKVAKEAHVVAIQPLTITNLDYEAVWRGETLDYSPLGWEFTVSANIYNPNDFSVECSVHYKILSSNDNWIRSSYKSPVVLSPGNNAFEDTPALVESLKKWINGSLHDHATMKIIDMDLNTLAETNSK